MRNFKDSRLKDSIFLLDLIAAIEPRAVDWDLVQRGGSDADLMANAKFAISNARKVIINDFYAVPLYYIS